MNVTSRLRRSCWFLMLLAGCFAVNLRADAQGLGIATSATSSPVLGTNAIAYSISLTNFSGLLLTNVFVTNTFSGGVSLLNTTNSPGTNFIVGASVVFSLGPLTNHLTAFAGLTVASDA